MPWKCPACQEPIRHSELETHPRHGVSYRCHVCRLELKLDPVTNILAVVPILDDERAQTIGKTD